MHYTNNRVTHFVVGHGPAERLRVNLPNNCTHEVHTMTSLMGEHTITTKGSSYTYLINPMTYQDNIYETPSPTT